MYDTRQESFLTNVTGRGGQFLQRLNHMGINFVYFCESTPLIYLTHHQLVIIRISFPLYLFVYITSFWLENGNFFFKITYNLLKYY